MEIQSAVAAHYGLNAADLRSRRQQRSIAHPRQLAMFLAHAMSGRSLSEIGRMFGHRDHSTVNWAINQVEHRLRHDPDLAADTRAITRRLAQLVADRVSSLEAAA